MAQNHPLTYLEDIGEDIYADDSDIDSLYSSEESGSEFLPERVLAQHTTSLTVTLYLVKWQDCPVIRSSWEIKDFFSQYPWLLDAWHIEQQRQAKGVSTPLNLDAFQKAVDEEGNAILRRQILGRLRRKVARVLSIVTTT